LLFKNFEILLGYALRLSGQKPLTTKIDYNMGKLNYDFDLGFYAKGFSKAQILGFTSRDIEKLDALESPLMIAEKKKAEKENKAKKGECDPDKAREEDHGQKKHKSPTHG
jgi:hypothetical protein